MNEPKWKKKLIKGYQKFRKKPYKKQKDIYAMTGEHGQNPDVMVIGCADSRVSPSSIFNAGPGELFVLRNVANIVPPFDAKTELHGAGAAVEYAVKALKVKAIMVMGHASCGGVGAFIASLDVSEDVGRDEVSFIPNWVGQLDKAHAKLLETDAENAKNQRQMEYAGVRQSLVNLMSFPFVEKAVEAGNLSLQGAHFDITRGRLLFANADGVFEEVPTKAGKN